MYKTHRSAALKSFPHHLLAVLAIGFIFPVVSSASDIELTFNSTGQPVILEGRVMLETLLEDDVKNVQPIEYNGTLYLKNGRIYSTENSTLLDGGAQNESVTTEIDWDEWRNKVTKQIWSNFGKKNAAEIVIYMFFSRGDDQPPIPEGETAFYICEVTSDRKILNPRIESSSGNRRMDDMLLKSVRSLDGKRILRFPEGSQRSKVVVRGGIVIKKTSSGFKGKKYDDVEVVWVDQ